MYAEFVHEVGSPKPHNGGLGFRLWGFRASGLEFRGFAGWGLVGWLNVGGG